MLRIFRLWLGIFLVCIAVFVLIKPSTSASYTQAIPDYPVAYLPLISQDLPAETPTPTETPAPTPTAPGDIRPPELITWSFAPTSVNTKDSDQTIDFAAHLTDNMSGLHYAIAWFYGPRGQQVYVWFRNPNELTTGTAQDGIYKSKLTMPRFSASGEWKLNYIVMYDRVNNIDFLYTKDLAPLGLPTSFQVTN